MYLRFEYQTAHSYNDNVMIFLRATNIFCAIAFKSTKHQLLLINLADFNVPGT